MKVLVIYAHPNPNSFNHAILEHVTKGLSKGNHTVTVLDLYAEQFNPVLVFNENKRRRDLKDDEEMKRYRDLVQDADHLIFIYPIWWYGAPAILKGFIDRVFVSEFAYTYEGVMPKGLLVGKSAWVVYTIDSPSWYVRLLRNSMEWKVMKSAVLHFCGIRPVKRLMYTAVKQSNEKSRQKWLDHVYQQALQL